MPAKNHRHKYYKGKLGETHKVWYCGLPDCTHYIPKHMESMANGKISTCWGCGADITLNPTNMEEDYPKCENCRLGLDSDEVLAEEIANAPLSDALKNFFEK